MHQIYMNAYVNICATASKNSSEGLFRSRDHRFLVPEEITIQRCYRSETFSTYAERETYIATPSSIWNVEVTHSALIERGWGKFDHSYHLFNLMCSLCLSQHASAALARESVLRAIDLETQVHLS